jgi:drug/metabolite transporter (DMT)-like permease
MAVRPRFLLIALRTEEIRMSGGSAGRVEQRMGAAEWAMLASLSVLWGGSFFFNGIAVRELPPFTIVAARVGIAALALWSMLAALRIDMPRVPGLWTAFIAMGLLNNAIPFALVVWGQHHVASGLAAILNATTPLFTVMAAHFLTPDEPLTPGKAVGVAAGLVGVVVMLGADLLAGLGTGLLAQAACLAAAMSYAMAGVFGRRFGRMRVPPLATAAGQVTASTLVMLPLALLADRPWALPAPGPETWGALVGLGLLSTALAYVLYFRILAATGATNLLLVTFLIPVSAILLGAMVLGERLEPKHFIGMALIGAGLAFIDGRLPGALRRPRSAHTC